MTRPASIRGLCPSMKNSRLCRGVPIFTVTEEVTELDRRIL
nr:MAG TPA: hypothetical protein [Caudoviricetes sp.]